MALLPGSEAPGSGSPPPLAGALMAPGAAHGRLGPAIDGTAGAGGRGPAGTVAGGWFISVVFCLDSKKVFL